MASRRRACSAAFCSSSLGAEATESAAAVGAAKPGRADPVTDGKPGCPVAEGIDNADNLVACSHWLYLSLRRAGRDADATAVLRPVTADLDVIENGDYHQLLLMYKGERTPETLLAAAGDDAAGSAVRYGVSAWHLVNGRRAEAVSLWKAIVAGPDWPSFGYLAAEAELAAGR